MTTLRKAAEMALEALEDVFGLEKKDVGAIQALRQALAQPEHEPVKESFNSKASVKEAFNLDRGCWERGCVAYDERDGDGVNISQERVDETAKREHAPVAWKHDCAALLQNDVELWIDRCPHCGKPRPHPAIVSRAEEAYEAAKQREWVGLDDEEVYGEAGKHERFANNGSEWFDRGSFAKAIEAKLKEKNT